MSLNHDLCMIIVHSCINSSKNHDNFSIFMCVMQVFTTSGTLDRYVLRDDKSLQVVGIPVSVKLHTVNNEIISQITIF